MNDSSATLHDSSTSTARFELTLGNCVRFIPSGETKYLTVDKQSGDFFLFLSYTKPPKECLQFFDGLLEVAGYATQHSDADTARRATLARR